MKKIITLCLLSFIALTTVKAQPNNALSFNSSSSQYVAVPHSSSINLGSTFTIEAWINYSGSVRTIIDKGDYDFLFNVNLNNDNKLGFFNNNTGAWKHSTGAVPQNTWTHVAITLSGGTLTFYINGVASGTASVTVTQDGGAMNIGRQSPTSCRCNHFNGQMDELRIWNIARTQSELAANYNTSIATNSSGLVAYYKFDEGTGSTLADATSNANNGTLESSPTWVTSGVSLTNVQIPTITSVNPTTGAVGSTVIITGTNFNTTAANNIVYFGGIKAATPSAASANSLTVTVPAGINYGPVSVTNTAINLSAYSKAFFSATKSPAKTSLTTGEFVASSNFSLGGGTWAMTASEGDFNNDGLLDVAVADYNNASGTSIKVFPNSSTSGTINFGTAVSLSAYSGTRGLAAADLDGDGKLELISVGTGTAKVSIFPNTTSGATISFGTKVDLTINGGAYYALAADFDGDGKIDIACANNNVVSVFLNTTTTPGSITFATKVDFATASGCIGLGVGDINGDGLPDLVTGNSGNNTNNMSVLRNTTSTPGSVSFAAKVDFSISSTTTSSYLNLADFDGDGKLDVAISNGNSRSISLFRNTSSGSSITFDSPYNLTGYFNNIGFAVGDINGDGLPDVAAADGGFWRIYLNTGTSGSITFSSNTDLTTGAGPWDASIADLDGDGRADVFGANGGSELRAYRYVPSFSNNADLSALTTTAGTISPTFAAATTAYTASVTNATTSVTVTPTKADANATIQVRVNSGSYATVVSGNASSGLSLNVGSNAIDVLVTAQDGTTTKTYTVTVTRAKADQTITFPALANKTTTDADYEPGATTDSGLAIRYTSSNTAVATVYQDNTDGNKWKIKIQGAGTTDITAIQDGDAAYNPNSFLRMLTVGVALPVSLISYDAKLNNDGTVNLNWLTASETNNSYFEVLRSSNGIDFTSLGKVNGAGNSTQELRYALTDKSPINGDNYYQLLQHDKDGKKTVLGIRTVKVSLKATELLIYPNPSTSLVSVNFDVSTYNKVELIDLSGKILITKTIGKQDNTINLDMSDIAAGTYNVRLIGEGALLTKQIVKQ